MGHLKKIPIGLPLIAFVIGFFVSAFSRFQGKKGDVSYFANTNWSTGQPIISQTVPGAYTDVTSTVASVGGVTAYYTGHCSYSTMICFVGAEQDVPGDPWTIVEIFKGTYLP
ncbi:MAG: hypothetical protein P4L51_28445 [Puia sp.]|nr:hypothetical protein [Puia sp.]